MTRSRRLRVVAAICIAAIVFASVLPASALFVVVLVPLPDIFGTVVSAPLAAPAPVFPQPLPLRSPLASRAPPA